MAKAEKKEEKTCFIIMPITTPPSMLDAYGGDPDHFLHVLDCLFVPAVEKAEYTPVRPIAEGADNIPAEIISNLESATLVLCDMSCLNPNGELKVSGTFSWESKVSGNQRCRVPFF